MDRKSYLIEYAKNEFNKLNIPEDNEVSTSILDVLCSCEKITNYEDEKIDYFLETLQKLLKCEPISPITEDDFVEETVQDGDKKIKVWKCNRYPSVYKTSDGNYWDDRAIVYSFSNDEQSRLFIYQGHLSSKKQITLPYTPKQELRVIDPIFYNEQ